MQIGAIGSSGGSSFIRKSEEFAATARSAEAGSVGTGVAAADRNESSGRSQPDSVATARASAGAEPPKSPDPLKGNLLNVIG